MRVFGVLLIIIGLALLIFLYFLSEDYFQASYIDTILEKKIVLKSEGSFLADWGIIKYGEDVVIQCKYIFVFGVAILILGFIAVVLHHEPKKKR